MAKFEAHIRNALAGQDAQSAELRQAVYQSSRNALQRIVENNRGLTVEAAMAQRELLEGAIERIEAEYSAPPEPKAEDLLVDENDPLYEVQQILMGGKRPAVEPVAVEAAPSPASTQSPVSEEPPLEALPQEPVPETVIPIPAEPVSPEPEVPAQPVMPQETIPEEAMPQEAAHQEIVAEAPDQSSPVIPEAPAQGHEAHNEPEPPIEQEAPAQQAYSTDENIAVEPATIDPFVEEQEFGERIRSDGRIYEDADSQGIKDYDELGAIPAGFTQRRRKQKIGLWAIITLTVLGLLGWLGYQVFTGIQDGSLLGLENNAGRQANTQADAGEYITVLTPNDLSSLIVAGRGSAELVTQSNTQMIRIKSMRDRSSTNQGADPILVRLLPGVLEQIENQSVTAEIFAKSGSDEQSQFSVSCQFANGSDCGRKRFVAGVQPQASVFAFDFGNVPNTGADYFITINTDTTSDADVDGEGDLLDIVYVRLKLSGSQ